MVCSWLFMSQKCTFLCMLDSLAVCWTGYGVHPVANFFYEHFVTPATLIHWLFVCSKSTCQATLTFAPNFYSIQTMLVHYWLNFGCSKSLCACSSCWNKFFSHQSRIIQTIVWIIKRKGLFNFHFQQWTFKYLALEFHLYFFSFQIMTRF